MDGPPILPKGVVKNSPSIYSSLERFKSEPLSIGEISELWKVYTTTKRRLLDPTAERLENYWWRIWGSRSRHLKAAIVVQIFADISEGQSFVPLTSQANRDEGTPPKEIRPLPRGASSTTAIHRSSTSRPGTTPKQTSNPPSILKGSDSTKKSRNPSTSGPKPTARFISPHESEEEVLVSLKTPAVIHHATPVVQEPTAEKKIVAPNGKRKAVFVASARGKRPVVVRRQSSQSSNDGSVRAETHTQSSADRTPPNFADHARELARQRGQISSQENSSSSSGKGEGSIGRKNTRLHGGRLPSPRKPQQPTRKLSQEDRSLEAGPSTKLPVPSSPHYAPEDLVPEQSDDLELQQLLLAQANARALQAHSSSQGNSTTSVKQSQIPPPNLSNLDRHTNGTMQPRPVQSKSAISLAPTLANAIGHTDSDLVSPTRDGLGGGKGRECGGKPVDDIFSKRTVQKLSPASVPHSSSGLSRSKSQLTLLLEKDRAKSNERSASSIDLKGKQKR